MKRLPSLELAIGLGSFENMGHRLGSGSRCGDPQHTTTASSLLEDLLSPCTNIPLLLNLETLKHASSLGIIHHEIVLLS